MGEEAGQPVRVIFVGEAPGRGSGPVLGGACGRRLAALAGVPEAELRRRCAFANLLPECPPCQGGGRGKGRTFNADRGRTAAAVLRTVHPSAGFVLLGRRVARAFDLNPPGLPHLADRTLVLAHPSGIVIHWNDPRNRRKSAVELRRFLRRFRAIPETKRPGRRAGSSPRRSAVRLSRAWRPPAPCGRER